MSAFDTIIRGGRVVTAVDSVVCDVGVKDGRIVLPDGMSYEFLVLPDREDIDWEVLKKIERLPVGFYQYRVL